MTPIKLVRYNHGATAAEFALVLPLLLLLMLGIIDTGRFAWEYNRAEKATQVGARVAVVTDAIPAGLATASYVGVLGLTQGDIIPASALGIISCKSTSGAVACGCAPPDGAPPCPSLGTANSTAFNRIVTRMQYMKPDILASNVLIEYRGSGLGFAGDPNGMEVAPIVTVRLTGLQFKSSASPLFGGQLGIPMPDFRTSLTAEDESGSQSN